MQKCVCEKRWFARPPVLVALGGVLPFGSIFIEMYFVFTSFWNYKFYYVYGFMLLVFIVPALILGVASFASGSAHDANLLPGVLLPRPQAPLPLPPRR